MLISRFIFVVITLKNLSIGYAHSRGNTKVVHSDLNAYLEKGQLVCLLGQNGSGKSTLIRTICGMQPMLSGEAMLDNIDIKEISLAELSTIMSVVLTDKLPPQNSKVSELVSIGRYPHTNWFGALTEQDMLIVKQAMEKTGLIELESRYYHELSDGEKQKVMIARALAQDTPIIILDEPAAHLDLHNRLDIMRLLKTLAHESGKTILLSTHDLDTALDNADKIWLLTREKLITGTPEDMVISGAFEELFDADAGIHFDRDKGQFRFLKPSGIQVSVEGEAFLINWTTKALERKGFSISDNSSATIQIEATCLNNKYQWIIKHNKHSETAQNIEEMLSKISMFSNVEKM